MNGFKFVEEPPVLGFFFGKLEPVKKRRIKLVSTFKEIGMN